MLIFNTKRLPLIEYLGNAAINFEHWLEISAITGVDVTSKNDDQDQRQHGGAMTETQNIALMVESKKVDNFSIELEVFLKDILDIDAEKFKDELSDISAKANKQ